MAERLPAVLKGMDRPKDVAERLALADVCYDTKHHAAAARFWAEALDADSKLGDDRQLQHRYSAACAAVLAATGPVKDDPPPDAAAKVKLRAQALAWLKAELAAWSKVFESGSPQERNLGIQVIQDWQRHTDLAGVRDSDALAKLPEPERAAWRALWADVTALQKRVQDQKP